MQATIVASSREHKSLLLGRVNPAEKSRRLCIALSKIVIEQRQAARLSMSKLSELSGLTRQMISYIESGQRIPTIDSIAKLATALGTTPSALLSAAEAEIDFR